MLKWLKVPILCNTQSSSALKDLGIEGAEDEYQFRTGCVRISSIEAFYPAEIEGRTIIHSVGDCVEVEVSFEEIEKILCS